MPARSLNLGCGRDIRPTSEGWVNMDLIKLEGVDVVHDFLDLPWPFEDGTFDHVLASHVLEHVPHDLRNGDPRNGFIAVMEELHRILRPGGTVEILAPHPESHERWVDPTHTRVLHRDTFRYFSPDDKFAYYTRARFRTESVNVTRRGPVAPYFLRLGRGELGLTVHLATRLPFLRPLLHRNPAEQRIVIRKV